ncbi:hypothetical protein [Endozoicomonas lisbonensis]|uniref:hypothetical protein n=1 Tax=Endozoicomonas lisbonensis TaxID=3120522 RepID=UPI0033950CAB
MTIITEGANRLYCLLFNSCSNSFAAVSLGILFLAAAERVRAYEAENLHFEVRLMPAPQGFGCLKIYPENESAIKLQNAAKNSGWFIRKGFYPDVVSTVHIGFTFLSTHIGTSGLVGVINLSYRYWHYNPAALWKMITHAVGAHLQQEEVRSGSLPAENTLDVVQLDNHIRFKSATGRIEGQRKRTSNRNFGGAASLPGQFVSNIASSSGHSDNGGDQPPPYGHHHTGTSVCPLCSGPCKKKNECDAGQARREKKAAHEKDKRSDMATAFDDLAKAMGRTIIKTSSDTGTYISRLELLRSVRRFILQIPPPVLEGLLAGQPSASSPSAIPVANQNSVSEPHTISEVNTLRSRNLELAFQVVRLQETIRSLGTQLSEFRNQAHNQNCALAEEPDNAQQQFARNTALEGRVEELTAGSDDLLTSNLDLIDENEALTAENRRLNAQIETLSGEVIELSNLLVASQAAQRHCLEHHGPQPGSSQANLNENNSDPGRFPDESVTPGGGSTTVCWKKINNPALRLYLWR